MVQLDSDGMVRSALAAYLSIAATPLVLDLSDSLRHDGEFGAAAASARAQVQPEADIHASADYRRHLVGVLTERALWEARREADGRRADA
jgi:carbon-monoxide dehydrogenase medium subunit